MFIRESFTINKKTHTKYVTHRLIESFRTPKGPRQRVVMNLGTLTLPKSEWPKLAAILEARLAGQTALYDDDNPELSELAAQKLEHSTFVKKRERDRKVRQENQVLISVDLNSVNTSDARSLGPELVAHSSWEHLGFDTTLKSCGLSLEQRALAKAVIIGRLVAPGTELSTWQWLTCRTALTELLPVDLSEIGKDAVYEVADILWLHKQALEEALYHQEQNLFPNRTMLFLYDLTNTYFEGCCRNNPLAQRGKSKEKRSDCPLVTLALLVDARGFPIFSRIYEGNQSEPETLPEILNQISAESPGLFPDLKPTIVMDRGIATKENVQLLKDRQYQYLVVERRPVEKEYVMEFETARECFELLNTSGGDPVYVKKVSGSDHCRVLVLSEGREHKETAMDTLKETRFIQDLTSLQTSVSKRRIQAPSKVSERIGRLKERYPSIAHHYNVELQLDSAGQNVVALNWSKKLTRNQRTTLAGCYVIETSHLNLEAPEIWNLYTTLTQVEAAFRDLKTDLGLRPIYHHLAHRTKAHLFISVLAYHLLISIEQTLRRKGDHRRWSTIREQLGTHQRITVHLTDAQKRIHQCRISSMPESIHQEIYRLLEVKDPLKRINRIAGSRL
jgi:transposase